MSKAGKSLHPPRELLRWLQSLDLAISIRNFKRDFSNGFLVAEVVSRYFERDVSMHSFDNGHSQSTKVNNWEQLRKLFHRVGFELHREDLYYEAMIDSRDLETVIEFMMQLYTFLTSRKVRREVVDKRSSTPGNRYVPTHSNSTASESKYNEQQQQAQPDGLAAIEENERSVTDVGGANSGGDMTMPTRALPRTSSKILRGPTRTVGIGAPNQQVLIKKVGVKALDGSIMTIRANRDANHNIHSMSDGGGGEHTHSESTGVGGRSSLDDMSLGGSRSTNSKQFSNLRPLLENLDSIVAENVKNIKPLNATVVFVRTIVETGALDEDVIAVMHAIRSHVSRLSLGCVAEPTDFAQLAKIFKVCLEAFCSTSRAFGATIKACASIGSACSELDSHISWNLFCDFLLDMVVTLGKGFEHNDVQLWNGLADLATAYSGHTHNYLSTVIKQLRQVLSRKMPVAFLRCLGRICATHSAGLRAESSLPMCVYYANAGLVNSSASVRALAIYILSRLVDHHGVSVIMNIVPTIESLYNDNWWEVQAQLACLAAVIVHDSLLLKEGVMMGDDNGGPDLLSKATVLAEGLVLSSLDVSSQWNVIQIGLCALAPVAHHNPILFQRFLEVLTSLTKQSITHILCIDPNSYDDGFNTQSVGSAKEGDEDGGVESKYESKEGVAGLSSLKEEKQDRCSASTPMHVAASTQLEYNKLRSPVFTWEAHTVALGICETLLQDGSVGSRASTTERAQTVPFDSRGLCILGATLSAVRGNGDRSGNASSGSEWDEVYDRASDSIVMALKDESSVRGAIDILMIFARDTSVGLRVLQHPGWPSALCELLASSAIPECAQVVSLSLQKMIGYGTPWRNALSVLLEELTEEFNMEDSPYVQNLLNHIEEMRM